MWISGRWEHEYSEYIRKGEWVNTGPYITAGGSVTRHGDKQRSSADAKMERHEAYRQGEDEAGMRHLDELGIDLGEFHKWGGVGGMQEA